MSLTDDQILVGMQLLGLDPTLPETKERLARIFGNEDRAVAEAELATLKADAKKLFKQLAHKLHPDKNGGDVEKTELFKTISEVVQEIDKIQIPDTQTSARYRIRFKGGRRLRRSWTTGWTDLF